MENLQQIVLQEKTAPYVRALAQYGIATLLCVVGGATPTFACTGSGLT